MIYTKGSVFPLLDFVRILCLNSDIVNYICREQVVSNLDAQTNSNIYFNILYKTIFNDRSNLVNSMLVFRTFNNIFTSLDNVEQPTNQKVLYFVVNERSNLFKISQSFIEGENKGLQVALATLLLNYSILFSKLDVYKDKFPGKFTTNERLDLIKYLNEYVYSNMLNWDDEAIFRVLVCVGNLVSKGTPESDYLLSIVVSLGEFKLVCERLLAKPAKNSDKVNKTLNYLSEFLD
jgi:hypothetical protein